MDPLTIGALANTAFSIFGPKKKSDPNTSAVMAMYLDALRKNTAIYNSTDFDHLDQQALEAYRRNVQQEAGISLADYDARLSAHGMDPQVLNTEHDLQKAAIANEAGKKIADLQYQQSTTRPFRQQQLLNPGVYAGGVQAGSTADAARFAGDQATSQGISSAIKGLVDLYQSKRNNGYDIRVGY